MHLFKHLAWQMESAGHNVLFTLREKEHEKALLEKYGFQYRTFGRKYSSTPGKIRGLLKFDYLEWLAGRRFKADMFISHGSMYAAHAASLMGKPHIALEDTGNMEQVRLYRRFSRLILSPETMGCSLGEKHILYPGFHELAHLHPDLFTPQPGIFDLLRLPSGTPYAVLRFVSLNATHDRASADLLMEEKLALVKRIERRMQVFVSCESGEASPLKQYALPTPPEMMHDVLACASLYVGNGATMAAEAGVLGTPSIYMNRVAARKCEGLARYGLVANTGNYEDLPRMIDSWLSDVSLAETWKRRREELLARCINLSRFLFWLVTQYPESENLLHSDPDIWNKFRPVQSELEAVSGS